VGVAASPVENRLRPVDALCTPPSSIRRLAQRVTVNVNGFVCRPSESSSAIA
jgi:hypothetical protein